MMINIFFLSFFLSFFSPGVPTCPVLDPPKDGLVSQSGTSIGDTATYSCILGFELVGNNRRTCVEPGQWSGAEPSCRSEHAQ